MPLITHPATLAPNELPPAPAHSLKAPPAIFIYIVSASHNNCTVERKEKVAAAAPLLRPGRPSVPHLAQPPAAEAATIAQSRPLREVSPIDKGRDVVASEPGGQTVEPGLFLNWIPGLVRDLLVHRRGWLHLLRSVLMSRWRVSRHSRMLMLCGLWHAVRVWRRCLGRLHPLVRPRGVVERPGTVSLTLLLGRVLEARRRFRRRGRATRRRRSEARRTTGSRCGIMC